jgi:hypothetical protein
MIATGCRTYELGIRSERNRVRMLSLPFSVGRSMDVTERISSAAFGEQVDTRVVTTRRAIKVQRQFNFSSFGEPSQKRSENVYCENSEDLSVNLIETTFKFRAVCVSSAPAITQFFSPVATCLSGQPYMDLIVAQYLFAQRVTLPFINGRAKCQTHRILQPRQLRVTCHHPQHL